MITQFLPKQPNDTSEAYALRIAQASYRPYVGQIVRAISGALFSAPYSIHASQDGENTALDPLYATFKEDCDGAGADLTSFFKECFRRALVGAASFWLAELPRGSADDDGMTDEEWSARGLDRPRVTALETCNVLDWEAGADGCFEWVKVRDVSSRRASPGAPLVLVETWRIFYDDRVEVYRAEYQPTKRPKPTQQIPLVESYVHGFARVPVLCMRLPAGLWLLDVAADAQLEHFRLSAALGWALRRCAYPLGVFTLKQGDDNKAPTTGAGMGVVLSEGETFTWAEPAGTSLAILRDEIKAQKDEIYRVTQQMAMSADSSAGALGRSGLSKMVDQDATDACLRDYATHACEAIEATFELISNARGDYDTTFAVEGLSTFDTAEIKALIESAQAAHDLGLEDDSPTFRGELRTRIATGLLPTHTRQGVKDAVRKEILESAKNAPKVSAIKATVAEDGINAANHGGSRTKTEEGSSLPGTEK